MNSLSNHWTKKELKIYILILCASADSTVCDKEIDLIKSKTDSETFEKMFQQFSNDTEEESLEKIDDAIQLHEYSEMELAEFRKEIHEIFLTDQKLDRKESNLDRILDNILY
ncbi:hypothetical protein ACFS5M_06745 [Lacinutrix iliipiscaria]|uniref:Tellurite resistance protein TerB n=1 Tax=Lacinutrix iliipiscaria TaxID=1230532 RepID=A0ABW5WQ57_9FLAO